MKHNILGLGTAAMDIVLDCEALPSEDGFAFIHHERLTPGGSCANVMATLFALDQSPGLIAQIGEDHFASIFLSDLKNKGMSADYIFQKPGGSTLHTYITVAPGGSKCIFANLGNSLLSLSENDVQPDWLEGIDVFYTDLFPAKPALKLARECIRRKIPVVFNLQTSVSFMNLCGITQKDIEDMLSLCSLLIASREGLKDFFSDQDDESACCLIHERYGCTEGVIVTLGETGAIWKTRESILKAPIFPVEARDTTGAGDAFNGGIIYAYFLKNRRPKEALIFSTACAALACTMPGPRFDADLNRVNEFLNLHAAGSRKNAQFFKTGILLGDHSNFFWTDMEGYYHQLAHEYGLDISTFWGDPEKDPRAQLLCFEKILSADYDAVIINPITNHNLVQGIRKAHHLCIPVFDVGVKTDQNLLKGLEQYYYPVRTVDFFLQGRIGAQHLIEHLKPGHRNKVALMPGRANAAQSIGRLAGARKTLEQVPDIRMIETAPGDFDHKKAFDTASSLLENDPDIIGFFCANDVMALGASDAVENTVRDRSVLIVGVDGIAEAVKAVQEGKISATVSFSTEHVARLLLETVRCVLDGCPPPRNRMIESRLITRSL